MNTFRERVITYSVLAFAVLCWGNSYLAIKVCLDSGFDWLEFASLRLFFTAIIFVPILLTGFRQESKIILKRDWIWVLLIGLVGMAGYHLCTNLSEERVSSGTTGLIIGLVPICTMLLEVGLGYERFSKMWLWGAIIAIGGLAAVMFGSHPSEVKIPNQGTMGVVFALGSVVIWSIYTMLCRPLNDRKYSSMAIVGWASVFACLVLPFTISSSIFDKMKSASLMFWLLLLFLCLFCTVISYLCYNYALKKLPARKVSEMVYFLPPFAVFNGWLMGKETINLWLILGAVLIVAGVIVSDLQNTPSEQTSANNVNSDSNLP